VKRWSALVSTAREGAEWLPMVKNALARIDDKGPSVAVAAPSTGGAPPEHNGSIEAMVERLAERLKKDGSDVPGWIQLVRSYRVLGKADKVKAAIADARAALASDPEALQRLDRSLQGLEAEVTPGASGPDVAGPPPSAAAIAPPGPNASRVAAAAQMAPVERNSMIEGMVVRLADRLKKDGSDVPGWIQLVRSYRVLGNADKAKAAIADAHAALANDREGLQRLEQGLEALQAEAAPGAPAPAPPTAAASIPQPGPNASQVAAAAQMAPAERNSMIEGMVARLAQRMAENGSDVDGWLRLIKAYSVLGERDKALAAATNARNALAGNSDNLRRIGELTKELGLEGS
jgi:cytochrome c-type biogenesis protein CcmH/NrfG